LYEPDEKDWKILRYIDDHPGCSKAAVERMMEPEASRVTVLNRLAGLEAEDFIVAKKDKPNSQIYKMFINANNLLVAETHDLEYFQKVFSQLLGILDKKRDELDTLWSKIRRPRGLPHEDYKPSDLILPIYSHMIAVYSAKSVAQWPKNTNDKDVLKQIYEQIFTKLFEILSTILNSLGRGGTVQQNDFNVVPVLLNNSFLLYPERLDILVEVFERSKIVDEVTPVIDSLWKISPSFFNIIIKPYRTKYPELEKYETFEDWKEFLKIWRIIKKKYALHYSIVF
jgi:hypothetical protein